MKLKGCLSGLKTSCLHKLLGEAEGEVVRKEQTQLDSILEAEIGILFFTAVPASGIRWNT